MANVKNIANAFVDGFGSLGSLFEPAERPGSRENLISQTSQSPSDIYFSTEAALHRRENIQEIVFRLRKSADLIESRSESLQQAAIKKTGNFHGI